MTCIGQPRTLLRTLMCMGLLGSLCAGVAAQPLLPPGTYASGGISSEGRAEMRAIRSLYNLHLAFAQAGTGGYIAGLAVSLQRAGQARTTLVCQDCGPLVYIALAPGSYTVIATWEGVSRSQTVRVGATPTQAVLYWPAPPRGTEVIRADPAEAM